MEFWENHFLKNYVHADFLRKGGIPKDAADTCASVGYGLKMTGFSR